LTTSPARRAASARERAAQNFSNAASIAAVVSGALVEACSTRTSSAWRETVRMRATPTTAVNAPIATITDANRFIQPESIVP
jgi:hypothetical protein